MSGTVLKVAYHNQGRTRALEVLGLYKYALSRLDKELQKGTITPSEVVPGASARAAIPGRRGAASRIAMRKKLIAPSAQPAEALNRLRAMRTRLVDAQAARPDVALGLTRKQKLRVVRDPHKLQLPLDNMENRFDAYMRNPTYRRNVGEIYLPKILTYEQNKLYGDPKLRGAFALGVLQHELGEFEHSVGGHALPYSSHHGTNPLVREKLQSLGDPVIQKEWALVRQSDRDDAFVEKLYRQVGGTPDSPIPLHGKQHRALNAALTRRAKELDPGSRLSGLEAARGKALFDRGRLQVPYVPKEIISDYTALYPEIARYRIAPRRAPKKVQGVKTSPIITKSMQAKTFHEAVPRRLLDYLGLKNSKQLLRLL